MLSALVLGIVILSGVAGCSAPQPNDQTPDRFSTVGGGEENEASGEYATISGGSHNTASAFHATVGGGSYNTARVGHSVIGGGYHNTAGASLTVVGGGYNNDALRRGATIGGGAGNVADGRITTIGGGFRNAATGWGDTISGGRGNFTSSFYPTVGGGAENTAAGLAATVAGGAGNEAGASHAAVGGGLSNRATDIHATVAGGYANTSSGAFATVPGGRQNEASGDYSLASGRRARIGAAHEGAFLYADSNDLDFRSAAADEFAVRATGGVRFVTSIDGDGDSVAGVKLAAGSGSWSSLSDREAKANVLPVDGTQVLTLVAEVPISTWNYTGQEPEIRHMGPMAQEFYATFGIGDDDRYIGAVDADGVALAAIQGLYRLMQEKDTQLANQQQRIAALEARLAALEGAGPANGSEVGPFVVGRWLGWLLFGGACLAGVGLWRCGFRLMAGAAQTPY